jgi:hypothetical protein
MSRSVSEIKDLAALMAQGNNGTSGPAERYLAELIADLAMALIEHGEDRCEIGHERVVARLQRSVRPSLNGP